VTIAKERGPQATTVVTRPSCGRGFDLLDPRDKNKSESKRKGNKDKSKKDKTKRSKSTSKSKSKKDKTKRQEEEQEQEGQDGETREEQGQGQERQDEEPTDLAKPYVVRRPRVEVVHLEHTPERVARRSRQRWERLLASEHCWCRGWRGAGGGGGRAAAAGGGRRLRYAP